MHLEMVLRASDNSAIENHGLVVHQNFQADTLKYINGAIAISLQHCLRLN